MTVPGTSRALAVLAARLRDRDLLADVPAGSEPGAAIGPRPEAPVAGVAYDSRRVRPGDLFVALRGLRDDGRRYVREAVARGAVAVMSEEAVPGLTVPQVLVRDGRRALAQAAAWFHADPSHDLGVVGVTGTDGKTTTAYLVRAILRAAGWPTGLVGTIDVIRGGRSQGNAARATTPEAPELQGHLAAMREAGDGWAVIESTSHGLAQERVGAVAWDVAVLTNLGHEHLEFHGTPEAYRAAKRRLFDRLAVGPDNPDKGLGKHAVINADDPVARDFARAARDAGARLVTYSLADDLGGDDAVVADLAADARLVGAGVADDAGGLRMDVVGPRGTVRVRLPLPGRFNAHNALAALGVAEALGLDPAASVAALAAVEAVPGRMERVDLGQPFVVVVDYAHTAEALAKVLDELGPLARSRGGGLVAVFGSAGERDTRKRPAMGRVAGERCRLVVVTDEDPRGEDRGVILDAIAAGVRSAGGTTRLEVIPDRRAAIGLAVSEARPGDVVLLAGKGHERSIETAGEAIPWDEAAVAREALREAGYGTGYGAGEVTSPGAPRAG